MRYSTSLSAAILASAVIVTAPTALRSQTVTEQAQQKAEQAWQKTKDLARDAKTGVAQKSAAVWHQTKGAGRDAKTGLRDSWLTSKIKIALYADERVKGRQVHVETSDGNVVLRGIVDSEAARAAATSLAEGIEHVRSVRSDLQVAAPADRESVDVSDADISRQLEDRLAKDARFGQVRVRTDRGVVTLTGDVSSIGASARASEIAREPHGVRAVQNELLHAAADGTPDVTTMQRALKQRGFDPGPIDGVFGVRTTAALKAYQHSQHLTITGRLDRDTAQRLGTR